MLLTIRLLICLLLLASSQAALAKAPTPARLNIIVLLADDMGWNGPSCYGSDLHRTPNLDQLAKRGMKFTNAYAACTVCSPTRAAMMTGKYPARLHLTDWIAGQNRPWEILSIPDWNKRLELSETTIAEALKKVGYRTAHVGKWHLGSEGHMPQHQGFEINVGGTLRGGPSGGYFLPNKMNLPEAKQGEYLTDHLTTQALKIIDNWQDEPFFLHFAYYTVHTPIQGKPDLVRQYQARVRPGATHTNATYAAMFHSLDESVGRIVRKLEQLKIADRTVILFTSDNGGLTQRLGKKTNITDNAPLRRGKGSAYEGGVRVPMIVHWPGVTKAGSSCDTPVMTIDYFPTIMQITAAGPGRTPQHKVDGKSFVPLLQGKPGISRDALFWHYPHYHAGGDHPYGAIRNGNWKLIEFYHDQSIELYDLDKDIGEAKNLATREPEMARRLRGQLQNWRRSVAAQMPTRNPRYDPGKALLPASR
ncbi:MAG: sulfatase [Pirellulaceae bacterium]